MRGKTNSEYIREELAKSFDAPAAEIVSRLEAIGLVNINRQDIYQQRNVLRNKKRAIQGKRNMTNQLNQVPLVDYITTILAQKPEGLSDYALQDAIKGQGYITHSDDFIQVLRKKLYAMVYNRILAKEGTQYSLTIRAKNEAEAKSEVKNVEQIVETIDQSISDKISDFDLLSQAVIEFAKAKGLENPETVPVKLIENQKKFNESQKIIAAQKEAIAKAERDSLELSIASLNIFKEKE